MEEWCKEKKRKTKKIWRDEKMLIRIWITPLRGGGDSKISGEEPSLEVHKHPR